MNEKELEQVESWFDGKGRYKLFDVNRLEILRALSGNELKIWMLHWCYELRGQESWLSLSTIMELTDLTKPTVITAHKRMEELGWLVHTGEYAASKLDKPTRGSYLIKVYRVDDPTGKKSLPPESSGKEFCGKKSLPNVSTVTVSVTPTVGIGPRVGTAVAATPTYCPKDNPDESFFLREVKHEPEPKTKATTKAKTMASSVKWRERYDADKPTWFDEAAHTAEGQIRRSNWLYDHEVNTEGKKLNPPRRPHPRDPPPPPRFKCPVSGCEFGHKYGYEVSDHIEKEHPEQGQQSFKIPCTVEGCNWKTWWNKINDSKEQADADLLKHVEEDHKND